MKTPRLTIGMAHHSDYHGVYFTIQALRLFHAEAMRDCEIIVIDNSAGSAHSQMLGGLIEGGIAGRRYDPGAQVWRSNPNGDEAAKTFEDRGLVDARVILEQEAIGTSATRDRIFKEARGEAVLVLDCHVMLRPGALAELLAWYENDRDQRQDIYHGPLLYDTLRGFADHTTASARSMDDGPAPRDITTHFDAVWRGQMFGTWGRAWQCNCGPDGVHLAAVENPGEPSTVEWRALESQTPISSCHNCGQALPQLEWHGHDKKLRALGFRSLGERDDDPPFAIPGCGLGVFTCRRDAWLGFNEHARGFGGEELYIHEKYRQHGRRAYCLPFLKWLHRFGRPDGVPYPLNVWNKVRNYVLEFDELGLDPAPIHRHFVADGPMSQAQWEHLTDNPVEHVEEPKHNQPGGCGGCNSARQLDDAASLDAIFAAVCKIPRDLDEHLPALRELVERPGVKHVTEISKRRESTIALLSARPQRLVSHQVEADRTLNRAHVYAAADGVDVQIIERKEGNWPAQLAEPTDLLFLDDQHRDSVARRQLEQLAPSVQRFIVLHDTITHGETGDDGGPGLLPAMRRFMRENPEWSVVKHYNNQHGLTVLARQPEDKPKLPPATEMAGNLGKALIGYVADGGAQATAEQLEERLLVCSTCEHRNNTRCAVCGCFLAAKAQIRSQTCPLGYWPDLTQIEK